MYIGNLKIALDDDSATYYDIKAVYSLLPDLVVAWPKPKTTYLNINGVNGGADLTEALGGVSYDYRQLTLRLTTRKDGLLAPDVAVNEFAKDYDGQRVRIKVLATSASASDYFFRGRLSITADDENKEIRQITCSIYAEPLKYSTTFTPSATGTDIRPTAWSANMWNSTNISGTGVTVSGATIPADHIADQNYYFYLLPAYFTAGKLVRIYLQNISNCIIEIRQGDSVKSRGAGSHIVLAQSDPYAQTNLYVIPIDHAQSASFECIVRTIDTTTITTDSKAVPLQIESTYVPNVNYPVKMFVNGTIFTVKPDDYSGTWREYAPAMLKTGDNKIATFVDVSTFDPSAAGSSGVLNVRYRGGVL